MDLLSSPPHGRYYMPSSPPSEPDGIECWPEDLWELFEEKRVRVSKCILTPTWCFRYKNILCGIEDSFLGKNKLI
jgi:hypothetical protein